MTTMTPHALGLGGLTPAAMILCAAAVTGGSVFDAPIAAGLLDCAPNATGDGCVQALCPIGEGCRPRCANYDPATGHVEVIECDCVDPQACHLQLTCVQPDNGGGTVDLPPVGCTYANVDDVWRITDGLPPGTTIELDGTMLDLVCNNPPCSVGLPGSGCETPGGTQGGNVHCFTATLRFHALGTGQLAGFERVFGVPVSVEVHTGPRNPGDPVQMFSTMMYRLQGELFGDPDFCTFRVRAGLDLGLPSPGQMTLAELPSGDFSVDSFFDVTYQIEFEGCPGSVLDAYAGTTTDTVTIATAGDLIECAGDCPPGQFCLRTETVLPDGTIDICCECVEPDCAPAPDGQACVPVPCPEPDETCVPACVEFDPITGEVTVVECECRGVDECRLVPSIAGPPCVSPDNGTGTVTLPPIGCAYRNTEDVWHIIEGLPPGATLELDGTLLAFDCDPASPSLPVGCPPPLACETPGGTLGGDRHCFGASLQFQVSGTGPLTGFIRSIAVPVVLQVDTAPRTPGDPVQVFDADLRQLSGELFGDPDFCTLRVRGGADFGLASTGQMRLTRLPSGDFAIDSFFDIAYEIEFEGCPGSQLDDYQGTTIGVVRMQAGGVPYTWVGDCPPGTNCVETRSVNADGTISVCCVCLAEFDCQPHPVEFGCLSVACPEPEQECLPTCLRLHPDNGITVITDCNCVDPTHCHLEPSLVGPPCVVPGTGGTAELPPAGCVYRSPDDVWRIVDGLPPGTEILFDGELRNFVKDPASGPGGSLGGEVEIFTATLDMPMTGTGDLTGFNRTIALPVDVVTHSAPRTPGDPMQAFDTVLFTLERELFGDPDFCTFRLTAGNGFNLPSPGHTRLIELPSGDYAVDSFFDVTYRIEWEGCPGSPLEDLGGVSTHTIRIRTGGLGGQCVGDCPPGYTCREIVTVGADGSIDLCCECVHCPGDTNGDGVVNVDDLVNVIIFWGTPGIGENPPGTPVEADITDNTGVGPPDGVVDVNDLNAVIINWGPCP